MSFFRSPLLAVRAPAADRLLVREGKQEKSANFCFLWSLLLLFPPSSAPFFAPPLSRVWKEEEVRKGIYHHERGEERVLQGGSNTIDTLSNYLKYVSKHILRHFELFCPKKLVIF